MKKTIIIIIIVVAVAGLITGSYFLYSSLSDKYGNTNTGETSDNGATSLPADFTVYDSDGNEVKLSDYLGKPIVINFWTSWCSYCKIEMPHFQSAYETYGDRVHFLMINVNGGGNDSKTAAAEYISTSGYTFPVFFDGKLSASTAYSLRGYPLSVFIDKDGNIAKKVSGAIRSQETLLNYIEGIL